MMIAGPWDRKQTEVMKNEHQVRSTTRRLLVVFPRLNGFPQHYTGNVDISKHLSTNDLNFDAFVRPLTA